MVGWANSLQLNQISGAPSGQTCEQPSRYRWLAVQFQRKPAGQAASRRAKSGGGGGDWARERLATRR